MTKFRIEWRRAFALRPWLLRLKGWPMYRMSLRNRLRFSIMSLVTVMVAIQFLATLRVTADADFNDVVNRSTAIGRQVTTLLMDRMEQEVRRFPSPPANQDETIGQWTGMLETDPSIPILLAQLMASSDVAVEVQVCDRFGKVLASSNKSGARLSYVSLPDLEQWNARTLWDRLYEIIKERRDYSTTVPIGIEGRDRPIFLVRIIVSSVLLRNALMPQINHLMATSALSLVAAMLLAVLFSNMVLRALDRLAKRIDYLTAGDFERAAAAGTTESDEIAVVNSKLNLLSEQFRDAKQMLGNIDQLLRSLEAAVMMFDPDHRLVLAGQAAERLLDRRREEMIGRDVGEVFPVETALGAAIQTAIARRQPFRDRPAIMERNGQTPLRVLVSVELLENLPGLHHLGTLVTLRDVDSRRRLKSQIDVSARLTAISRLTSGVAHEIKNPLNAIALHLEILKAKMLQSPEISPEMDVIEREITRLDRVVKTFLDFTRPVELTLKSVDLLRLLREVTALVSPEAEAAGVRVSLQTPLTRAGVEADPDLLKQAILNVVMNGIEAMPDGGLLTIVLDRAGDEYQLQIADEGVGIPAELRDKIFNLYFTTKSGGSGIGLAMTFRVVHLHNGTIDFTSEMGVGATFRLRIPASDDAVLPAAEQRPETVPPVAIRHG